MRNEKGNKRIKEKKRMTCPYCKKEVTMSAGFCPECGLSISKKCDTEKFENLLE